MVPFKLWYNSVFPKRGEPPVVLDLISVTESKDKIDKYLASVGYFDSKVMDTIKYKKNKAKKVTYLVTLSVPYRIRQINTRITDDSLEYLVLLNKEESLLKTGEIFNTYKMDAERTRMASVLNANGYFAFNKDYIYYEVDSTHQTREIDLTMIVKNVIMPPLEPNEPPVEVNHKVYYINNVNIYPNIRALQADTALADTIIEMVKRKGDTLLHRYNVIYTHPLKIKPKVLTRSIFIEKDDKYNSVDAQQTYKKLAELRINKHITVNFKEAEQKLTDGELRDYLDCNIQMTRQPVHSYSIEAQGTTSGGDLGLGGYLVYQNKNLFRGGEIFNLRLKGALEAQDDGSTDSEAESDNYFIL